MQKSFIMRALGEVQSPCSEAARHDGHLEELTRLSGNIYWPAGTPMSFSVNADPQL